ncbi:ABC transporter permease [Sunxiuqinia elliptica]|uniref:ABC-type transport system, involved in lipoprotein release, permease component n=1 Tax=Sunxiuqinia elliptica TaxID=655355 RepID=A0A1I2L405_9BACT|nr:FtsX-like permease family protein [Sunxiuqinia elliptica]SFF73220.1 ABC-type transport system, involved in lipoprotein release, permease component [Sunxiuqinia elliptica]
MSTNIKIAWRNLWRNKRRTLITVASIFFGVLLSAYMTSMQEGSYEKMVDMVVKYYSGYMQVHHENYWESKSINDTFEDTPELRQSILDHLEVDFVIPRLESFALASSEELTKGVLVMGIEPESENRLTSLKGNVNQGSYLQANDQGLLVGEGLANYLHLGVNDTLVMISQGYHGISAAGKYPIRGIIKHASPQLNKMIVYMTLPNSQDFFSTGNRLTSLVVNITDTNLLNRSLKQLRADLKPPYSIMSWQEMSPEMVQQIESDRAGGIIMKAVLYIVIGFGILGTIMMMIAERRREFGVMIAIGMQRIKLGAILFYETLFIGMIGALSGLLVSIPILMIQAQNPIPLTGQAAQVMDDYGFEPYMFFSLTPSVFWHQALTVFIITMVIAIYPIISANRMKLINALHA